MFIFFWTGIPTIISIFDMISLPKTISEFNLAVVQSLCEQIALESYTNTNN
jgi:TM2 domain-containing membrane protein YozV